MTPTLIENKEIKAFLDTNVIIDALTMRDNDYLPSRVIWRNVIAQNVKGYICAKQITDLYYIFKKYYPNEEIIRQNIANIVDSFETLPLLKGDILACLNTKMSDFEDAILFEVAKVNMINVIVTNNVKHYQGCKEMILTPKQFLDLFQLQ